MNARKFAILILAGSTMACASLSRFMSSPNPVITELPTFNTPQTEILIDTPVAGSSLTPAVLIPDLYNESGVENWTEMIARDPQNADYYYRRADAIFVDTHALGSQDAYVARLDFALQDVNMAISLQPDNGDYYYLRRSIYDDLASVSEYIADSQSLSNLALADAYQVLKIGTPFDYYPDRTVINELIATGQCDQALASVEELMNEEQPNDASMGGLLHIRSRAYACLGRLDDALQSVNDSMFNNENMEYKNELKAQYLILLGRYDEALPLLDEAICHCQLAGWHYYLRAEIYYNNRKKDLVQEELSAGMPRTWSRGGMLSYVEAQLALDEGRKDDAIQLLQIAEATFTDPIYNSLRWKVQDLLKELNAEPLIVTPSITFLTPIP